MKRDLLLSMLTGLMLTLAFPPFKLGFLAYGSLIPFFLLLEDKTFGESFRWAYLTGLFVCIGTIYWINWVTLPGGIAAIVVLPLYFSIYALLHSLVLGQVGSKGVYTVPFLWTGVEYLRSLGEIGFPWTTLGYTQTHYLTLIQYASYTSVFGVSFWVVTINVLLFQLLRSWRNRKAVLVYAAIILAVFLVPWLYGRAVIPEGEPEDHSVRLALVQGNIDPLIKWDKDLKDFNFAMYERLTYVAAEEDPDCIVWPETATPCNLRYEQKYLNRVRAQVDSLGLPLLTGTPDYAYSSSNGFRTFNSAFLFLPHDVSIQSYAKMQLVPFGERVPYQDSFPFRYIKGLLDALEMGQGDWSPGRTPTVFELPVKEARAVTDHDTLDSTVSGKPTLLRFSVPICYESAFPDLVRKFVTRGAEYLVIITNDAWFGRPDLPKWLCGGMHQHARMAVFRAIENRIAIGRCANTGVSAFIDPYGRMRQATKIFTEAVIVDDIPLRSVDTFYSRHGNVFTKMVCAIGVVASVAAPLVKRFV